MAKQNQKSITKNINPNTAIIILRNGRKVPREFYDRIKAQVKKQMPEVKPGTLYTARLVCGEAFWNELENNPIKGLAGMSFSHMVHKGLFPFNYVKYKKITTNHYLLK